MVYGNAMVSGNTIVFGNAMVYAKFMIYGNAEEKSDTNEDIFIEMNGKRYKLVEVEKS